MAGPAAWWRFFSRSDNLKERRVVFKSERPVGTPGTAGGVQDFVMEVQKKGFAIPEVKPAEPRPAPELVPVPARRRKPSLWWWLLPVILLIGAGLYWRVARDRAARETAAGAMAQVPAAAAEVRPLERTIRLSGSTRAEKYARLIVPRLEGSRSGRGREARTNLIQANSTITVNSTSTVARSSTASRLSQTGMVASSGDTGGGGFSGAPRSGSSAMRAATSRVGSAPTAPSSGGNITSSSQSASALGGTGLGSTASSLSGGAFGPPAIGGVGGGAGRRRGDFQLALQKLAPAGIRVKKGDVVAEFDRQYMLLRLEDYEASVAQTKAAFEKGKADLLVTRKAHDQSVLAAKSNLEKARLDIKATPVLSPMDTERLKLALEEAEAQYQQLLEEVRFLDISEKAQVRVAELEVKQAEVELRRAENNVDKLVAKAPIDGMVVHLNVFRGGEFGQVREGDELWGGMPFVQIVEPDSMVVDAKVNQVDADKIRIGQRAYVRFDAFPDLVLPARVYSVGTVAVARQYRQEYVKEVPVLLKLEQMDPRVIPDLSASVDVIVEREEKAVVVPAEALFSDPGDAQRYVFVKAASGWQKRPVEVGLRNHVAAAVRSGLKPGEMVALRRPPAAALAGK
jgi:HlyD family secretion protein